MTGSLQEKNGIYYMVLNTYENGKRKQRWFSTGLPVRGNKRRAEQLLREKIRLLEAETGRTSSNILFSDYVRRWLSTVRHKVDPVTFQGYEVLAKRHILPWFDEHKFSLHDLNAEVLQGYMDEKAANGRVDGKGGLSPRSLILHKNILSQTLDEGVKSGLLPANPCRFLSLPRVQRHEAHFYTAQQLQALFDAIRDEPLYPLVKIAALYGLRRSELLGLKWDSIDFERKTLTIRHTVSKVTKAVEKDKTKNASSYRSFPLIPEAETIFRREQEAANKNRRLFGRQYQENDSVFKWPDGHPFSPDYVTDRFSSLLRKHGLPPIRFHELRHSCASLLLNAGFHLKDVQEWMGHADIKMTANIYGHLDVRRKQDMAARLGGVLKG
ncbi:site-specific integrase [Intestinimonas massiliensis (ex Afouda et al. 2020)]|uniref:site-specific integrase n=1 Tax=Intestinimonas massiliensis (ex Afouda et al. 2020) TaxID=1673721 RepID=UPI00102F3B00|nr:site-specific integrase [Intestinimonas massiliensis (ex Afouda et al. 2020)]